MVSQELTFVSVKPDGLHRGLVHEVIKRFEQHGFLLVAIKMVKPTMDKLEEVYETLQFYVRVCMYIYLFMHNLTCIFFVYVFLHVLCIGLCIKCITCTCM